MEDIKGLPLCRGFFREAAQPILRRHFPDLIYTAALIGYGSDVLGYDDEVSRDHMWGPRFYLFLRGEDMAKKPEIMGQFAEELPYVYRGFSVNFTAPDEEDNGVRHPQFISEGKVNPLIFITTVSDFLTEQLGTANLDALTFSDWLSFSEHRLLSLQAGELFEDGLNLRKTLEKVRYYPEELRLWLLASCWDSIASEEAFMGRCAEVGDEIGSLLVCGRICQRLMELCFLYKKQFAPYSKWLGSAFRQLAVPRELKDSLLAALIARDGQQRERALLQALQLTVQLHNESGLTPPLSAEAQHYYGRTMKVIFAERFADACLASLSDSPLKKLPLTGTFSQLRGLSNYYDDLNNRENIKAFFERGLL